MNNVIKPPSTLKYQGTCIFLAGSIEMGSAEDWQTIVTNDINHTFTENLTIFNPRRDEWNSSWKQEQSSPQFNEQVNWELNALDHSDIIFMYFDPTTKSPISLLELGLYSNKNMIVCCPDGFWRKGNVEIVCARHNIPLYNTLNDGVGALITKIRQVND